MKNKEVVCNTRRK